MERKILILGKSVYKFTDRDNGNVVSGTKISYIDLDDTIEKEAGYSVATQVLPYDMASLFPSLPAIYTAVMDIKIISGKHRVSLRDFVYSNNVDLNDLSE